MPTSGMRQLQYPPSILRLRQAGEHPRPSEDIDSAHPLLLLILCQTRGVATSLLKRWAVCVHVLRWYRFFLPQTLIEHLVNGLKYINAAYAIEPMNMDWP